MDKESYFEKLNILLSDNTTYDKLRPPPLKTWQRNFNHTLKTTLKANEGLYKRFNANLPSLPYIYGLPKMHKADIPLLLIISATNSVPNKYTSYQNGSPNSYLRLWAKFRNHIFVTQKILLIGLESAI